MKWKMLGLVLLIVVLVGCPDPLKPNWALRNHSSYNVSIYLITNCLEDGTTSFVMSPGNERTLKNDHCPDLYYSPANYVTWTIHVTDKNVEFTNR